tara:strand:- start:7327 stop:7602 length:276 start_codon:yes stop_codon:yes gene_type:complete
LYQFYILFASGKNINGKRVTLFVRILFLLLLFGCSQKKELTPKDTLFLEKNRNWAMIYEKELQSALENEDHPAFYFFWPEYLKALEEQRNN